MARSENRELLCQCEDRLCLEFGVESGRSIMMVIIEELGGFRITVPTKEELERENRDRRIRTMFNGANTAELGQRFRLSPRQIRRIVNDG